LPLFVQDCPAVGPDKEIDPSCEDESALYEGLKSCSSGVYGIDAELALGGVDK
jgi:hypothetical protein